MTIVETVLMNSQQKLLIGIYFYLVQKLEVKGQQDLLEQQGPQAQQALVAREALKALQVLLA
jgi:hypothetical protein